MAHNVVITCVGCGRSFTARTYHYTFKCRECRNASCEVRNNALAGCATDCPNLKWAP